MREFLCLDLNESGTLYIVMSLEGKTVAILIEQLYQELEVWYPYYRLKEEGATVYLVGPEKGVTYPGKVGYPATAERSIDEISVNEFDAVVIPGGYAPDHMRRNEAMVQLVKDMHACGKIIAAICHAGWMLASADVVQGKKVTSFSAIRDDMVHAGATFLDKKVVQDGNIITSRRPDDLPVFCRTIIEALAEL